MDPGTGRAIEAHYREHFEERIRRFGENVQTLWSSAASQTRRFEVLTGIGDLAGRTVLDVGCGFGDFLGFLHERGIRPSAYVGVEMVPLAAAVARKRHPDARIVEGDFLSAGEPLEADYAFASGLFFLKHDHWTEYVQSVVDKMFRLARRGVAVNFLSARSLRPDDISHYAEPPEVLRLLMSRISRVAALRHDYLPNDFTVYLYKETP